ncbi:MAG: efflux RND transporter permease subunit [Planctomycetales bacterium]|nr:efflux RND transporter permease subunit [Planctomycetales bacterium]
MKNVIRWAVRNSPAMNTMLIATLVLGAFSLFSMRREVFPEFELEILLVTVPYPGASPTEVEEGICQKVEEAVSSISGIRKQTSIAREGAGFLVIELEPSVKDPQKILAEVRSEIDQIPSFPELAEDPEVKQITFRSPAIHIGITGPSGFDEESQRQLRSVAEQVRNELMQLPPAPPDNPIASFLSMFKPAKESGGVTSAVIVGALPLQIDVEVSEDSLRQHGLTLQQVAQMIRRENLEFPGGTIRSSGQELVIRSSSKSDEAQEIERIKVVALPNGDVLSVGDLGEVRDTFEDRILMDEINGRPGIVVRVERTSEEDLLNVVATVKQYVATKQLPPGYQMTTWGDQSIDVRDRLDMLVTNGLQGLALVFIVLSLFLELRLAFWVALGIPVSVLGASAVLLYFDQTLNMLTMFAFLLALGIVVDDAIVISENIYSHREQGKPPMRAAIDGAYEVLPSVASSIATTIVAFMPLFFVSGVMGKFIAVMPLAVIAMLLISLAEAVFTLPMHLGHDDNAFMKFLAWLFSPLWFVHRFWIWLSGRFAAGMDFVANRFYGPLIAWCLNNKISVVAAQISAVLLTAGLFASDLVPFEFFPKMDARQIEAAVAFPDGSPPQFVDEVTQRMADAIERINQDEVEAGRPAIFTVVRRTLGSIQNPQAIGPGGTTEGSHVGSVQVALVPLEDREITSDEILIRWRSLVGEVVGADSVKFVSENMGPGGNPIEFKLLAKRTDLPELQAAVEEAKGKLRTYTGVFDIEDDDRPGKWELQINDLTEEGQASGITLDEIIRTTRAAFYGEEVMRLQRGRNEVKLMVRYPLEDRRSIEDLSDLRVRTADGLERPVGELAEIEYVRSSNEINRIDQMRSITISGDVDTTQANSRRVMEDFRREFIPQLKEKYPNVFIRWEGQQQQTAESFTSMFVGFALAMVGMYVLLTVEFRSYAQPLLIMAIIPFGIIGATFGHFVMQIQFTIFSMFGLVALTGVVVNDSIVLLDFINHKVRDGHSVREAVLSAGLRRFRPVWLTSMTTMAGLVPVLLETSFQAQVLIPMAASLCFGVLFSTVLVLIQMPVLFEMYASLFGISNANEAIEAHLQDEAESPDPPPLPQGAATLTSGPTDA